MPVCRRECALPPEPATDVSATFRSTKRGPAPPRNSVLAAHRQRLPEVPSFRLRFCNFNFGYFNCFSGDCQDEKCAPSFLGRNGAAGSPLHPPCGKLPATARRQRAGSPGRRPSRAGVESVGQLERDGNRRTDGDSPRCDRLRRDFSRAPLRFDVVLCAPIRPAPRPES